VTAAAAAPDAPDDMVDPRYREPRPFVDAHPEAMWMRRLWPIVRPLAPMIAVGLLCAVTAMALRVVAQRVAGQAIDRALVQRVDDLAPYSFWLVGMGVAVFGLGVAFRYCVQRASYDIEYTIRLLLFRQFLGLSFSFYDRAQTGQLISRANSDVRAIQVFLMWCPLMSVGLITFVVALVLMVQTDVLLTLVALAGLPFVFACSRKMHGWLYPVSWLVAARQADVATIVEENVGGAQLVRSFAAEAGQIKLLDKAARRLEWAAVRMAIIRAQWTPVVQNLPNVGPGLLLLYGGHLAIDGRVSPGQLYAFFNYLLMMQAPFRMIGFLVMQSQRASASTARIMEVLDEESELVERPDALVLDDCQGHVRFDDVRFGYGTQDAPVLEGLSLEIRPGETVALVGRTGSGKSTVARLVPRFYDVEGGAVLVDGHDVRDLDLHGLRADVGLVLDDSFLFSGTVRENIAFGRPDATEAEILAAAQAAGAEDFIGRLPDGYDTMIGERGSTLSGGQRQRIAIARTLLVNPRILILDDCTSSIDAHREHEIHGALRTLMAGRTTLIIAHRLSTIALAERVVLLDGGRILADGTHEDLLRDVPEYADILKHAQDGHHGPDGALPDDHVLVGTPTIEEEGDPTWA
jgi:ATP-binding cassette subfamily B protein